MYGRRSLLTLVPVNGGQLAEGVAKTQKQLAQIDDRWAAAIKTGACRCTGHLLPRFGWYS